MRFEFSVLHTKGDNSNKKKCSELKKKKELTSEHNLFRKDKGFVTKSFLNTRVILQVCCYNN